MVSTGGLRLQTQEGDRAGRMPWIRRCLGWPRPVSCVQGVQWTIRLRRQLPNYVGIDHRRFQAFVPQVLLKVLLRKIHSAKQKNLTKSKLRYLLPTNGNDLKSEKVQVFAKKRNHHQKAIPSEKYSIEHIKRSHEKLYERRMMTRIATTRLVVRKVLKP